MKGAVIAMDENENIPYEIPKFKVFIKTDENNNIIGCEGGASYPADLSGWIEIDEGSGDKFYHAQNHYFSRPLLNENGICRYKFIDGKIIEKSDEEMAAEYAPPPEPLTIEDLAEAVAELASVFAEVISNG